MKEKMKQAAGVELHLSEEQFLVIYEFLYNVKLGDNNKFESAISDLMQDLEEGGVEVARNIMLNKHGEVNISVLATQLDGMEFRIE
jgi:hypothetical protein